jgi:hypothetical protein
MLNSAFLGHKAAELYILDSLNAERTDTIFSTLSTLNSDVNARVNGYDFLATVCRNKHVSLTVGRNKHVST